MAENAFVNISPRCGCFSELTEKAGRHLTNVLADISIVRYEDANIAV